MMISKMINADVVVENKSWNKKIKDPNNYIKKKIKKIYKFNSLKKKHFSLTILLTNNSKMRYLNNKFRNKSKTTDVLSFPNLDTVDLKKKTNTEIYLGDIALSYEIINRRSKDLFKNLNEISIVDFDNTDDVRHPLVIKILKAYDDFKDD